jgi:transcriptional regulator with XRE-family HTH domain
MVPQLRSERGIKIKDIARVLGVSRPVASEIGNGRRLPSKPEDLDKLCRLLGVNSPRDLFGDPE